MNISGLPAIKTYENYQGAFGTLELANNMGDFISRVRLKNIHLALGKLPQYYPDFEKQRLADLE